MKTFVPASDEQIFDSIDESPVPYRVGLPCFHWFAVLETPDGQVRVQSADARPGAAPISEPAHV